MGSTKSVCDQAWRPPFTLSCTALYICLLTLLQEEMKLSLILNVVDPRIGGVMVMGDRGTGKTTAVRALADLLPQLRVRQECVDQCGYV